MRQFLTYAGRSTKEFGIFISGEGTFSSPERNTSSQEVPGRNGALLFDMGNYKNAPVKYPAFIISGLPTRIRDFLNFAGAQIGYQRLEDTYHPYEFRMAKFKTNPSIDTAGYMNKSGKFTLEFDCKPQRFLKSGEEITTLEADGVILNRTLQNAKPLLRVYGTAGSIEIGAETIEISAIDDYVDIDCEIMDAYKGAVNCNSNVSFTDDIVLSPGDNNISLSGGITKIEITPRWFII